MTFEAGVLELAEGTAASLKPGDALESMFCDVIAASYNAAMRLIRRASTNGRVDQIAALTRASGRMMTAFTDAALALHRIRSGGRQNIVVQHVAVEPGAQAIVAVSGYFSTEPGCG